MSFDKIESKSLNPVIMAIIYRILEVCLYIHNRGKIDYNMVYSFAFRAGVFPKKH